MRTADGDTILLQAVRSTGQYSRYQASGELNWYRGSSDRDRDGWEVKETRLIPFSVK